MRLPRRVNRADPSRSGADPRLSALAPRSPPPQPLLTQKHPTGKLGRVLNAVAATQGASLDELVELTGWQPHTARAALTRLRQRGFAVGLRETADRKAYHLAEAVSQ